MNSLLCASAQVLHAALTASARLLANFDAYPVRSSGNDRAQLDAANPMTITSDTLVSEAKRLLSEKQSARAAGSG